MPFPPDLFLIGAQKAGTTYLANLLGQHPDICLANPKEPNCFTRPHARTSRMGKAPEATANRCAGCAG